MSKTPSKKREAAGKSNDPRTETDQPESKEITALPPGAKLETALVPRGQESLWVLAKNLARSSLLPGHLTDKARAESDTVVANIFWVMCCGAEVGLTPTQSLLNITPINGNPTMWGDVVIGLVRASGKAKYISETMEGDPAKPETLVAWCKSKRADTGEIIERSFSYLDAETADLLKKDNYKKYLRRMLQMRARSWCLRDGYGDVLKGIRIREEEHDHYGPDRAKDITPRPQREDIEKAIDEVEARVKVDIEEGTKPAPEAGAEKSTQENQVEDPPEKLAEEKPEPEPAPGPEKSTEDGPDLEVEPKQLDMSDDEIAKIIINDFSSAVNNEALTSLYNIWDADIRKLPREHRNTIEAKFDELRETLAAKAGGP